jgi:ABC-type Fe3+ transport system substrate-binding protein
VKGSKKLAAQAFVEWLLQAPQQHWYADLSYFHPVLTDASAIPSFLTSLFGGPVRENQAFALSQAGDLREEALSLMRAVGWKTLSEIKKP